VCVRVHVYTVSFDRRTLCSYTLKSKEMDMFQKAIDEVR
jgi:hypothetical protein